MGLEVEADRSGGHIHLIVCIHNGTDHGVEGVCMGGNDAYIAAHDLHIAQLALESTIIAQLKAFGTDTNEDLLICNAGNIQNSSITEAELAILHSAFQHIDGGCTQELCNEQIAGIIY